ncbi:MAG TPA: hypothetical protein VJ851_15780 [Jatrophihabitans sp.]|nr:hypothetical protein [Jatrophihabitans sp.]
MLGTSLRGGRRHHGGLWAAGITACLLLLLAGCTSSGRRDAPSSSVTTPPSTQSGLAGDGEQPSSATTHPSPIPTGPIVVGSVTEKVASRCPYIDTAAAADAEGNRIGTVSVLTVRGKTMGCRFRFAYGDNHYTLEITSARYADATAAYNAMVQRGRAGGQVTGVPGLVPGVDAVLYRTSFYPPDGNRDWACTFAKGSTMVTVKTDQTDTSQDAENVARLIVSRF